MENSTKLNKFSILHSILLIIFIGADFIFTYLEEYPLLYTIPFFSFLLLIAYFYKTEEFFKDFGVPNIITLSRGLFVTIIAILCLLSKITNLEIMITGIMVIILDRVDGILADKLNQKSEFGEYLDPEIDSYFVLTYSFLLHFLGIFNYWIIIVGGLRYFYVLLIFVGSLDLGKQKAKWINKVIFVYFSISLSLAFLDIIFVEYLVISSSLAIVYSFVDSFYHILMTE